MPQSKMKRKIALSRRDTNKLHSYGAKTFSEVKRYDGEGNLIEVITPDELMSRPIGSTIKRKTMHGKRIYQSRLSKTNGEGSMRAWSSLATKVKRGDKVDYKKEKL